VISLLRDLYQDLGVWAMSDLNDLLNEADELGILNIDVGGNKITPEIMKIAIRATKRLNSELDDNIIAKKIQEAELIAVSQQ